jgi:two-component system sensor histidine kinase KdpD
MGSPPREEPSALTDRDVASRRAAEFLQLIRRTERGRLKVYLGYGPGVGKTYRMLQEARALAERGVDLVVGYVEPHGRPETQALLEGLEEVPPRVVEYLGLNLKEMDVVAVRRRKPQVAVVDELAHTNAPGSRNRKRYEDVQELLDTGIHVLSTLNVQHLESLYDIVERQTGVKVKERIPDRVLEEADQVVNVDLPTEELQERLKEGKVYPQERVPAALANFFRAGNLQNLRNLTLREVASHIEERSRVEPGAEIVSVPDQVLVCLSSLGPDNEGLLRYASRLAGRLNRTWYALYVQTPAESEERVDALTQRRISDALALANRLGGTVFTFHGEDVVATIAQFGREYGVGHIVVGRSDPVPWWKRLLGQRTLSDRLIEATAGRTVVVVDPRSAEAPAPADEAVEARPPAEPRAGTETGAEVETEAAPPTSTALLEALTPSRVVIWDEPVDRDRIVSALLERIVRDRPEIDYRDALEKLREREAQGTTWLADGIALPHARIEGLDAPELALGLPREGVRDGAAGSPTQVVWLLLLPVTPTPGLMPTAVLSRFFQDANARRALARARQPEQAVRIARQWERRHRRPPGSAP